MGKYLRLFLIFMLFVVSLPAHSYLSKSPKKQNSNPQIHFNLLGEADVPIPVVPNPIPQPNPVPPIDVPGVDTEVFDCSFLIASINSLIATIENLKNQINNYKTFCNNTLSEMNNKYASAKRIQTHQLNCMLSLGRTNACKPPSYNAQDWQDHNPAQQVTAMKSSIIAMQNEINKIDPLINNLNSLLNDLNNLLGSIADCNTAQEADAIQAALNAIISQLALISQDFSDIAAAVTQTVDDFNFNLSLFIALLQSFLLQINSIFTAHDPLTIGNVKKLCRTNWRRAGKEYRRRLSAKRCIERLEKRVNDAF
ncbi:MAG: hypothetical protein LW817_04875 [Candidatus Caenarcaniphilales bacterium]|jgi:ElaB/YqjD/DUF883 family membrane-anchored ribosome-binding protein|nr:hypothetical protein [Candidatus Caenarcaniphilales bacterium]